MSPRAAATPEQEGHHKDVQKSLGWDFGDKPGAAQASLAKVEDSKGSPQAVCESGRAQQTCEGLNPP